MRIKLLVDIAGTIDGQNWPARGGEIDLPKSIADDMIANRYAEPVQRIETAAVNPVAETAARPAAKPRKTTDA